MKTENQEPPLLAGVAFNYFYLFKHVFSPVKKLIKYMWDSNPDSNCPAQLLVG